MPFASHPVPPCDGAVERVAAVLDPVLTPLGFAPGQPGASGGHGQVIFCRGYVGGSDGGCVDLVIDLEVTPEWRITDVRYWGYPGERWHLAFDRDGDLVAQLSGLTRTLGLLAAGVPVALTAVLADPRYGDRARMVADEMAALPPPATSAALFEDLARTLAP